MEKSSKINKHTVLLIWEPRYLIYLHRSLYLALKNMKYYYIGFYFFLKQIWAACGKVKRLERKYGAFHQSHFEVNFWGLACCFLRLQEIMKASAGLDSWINYRKVASRSTCYYSENQVFGGATNRDMSLNETCFYS